MPVSDLCEELGLQPTVFYRWQKVFFENGAAAFQGKGRADYAAGQQRIEFLETEIHVERDLKLEEARRQRQLRRLAA